MLPKVSWR